MLFMYFATHIGFHSRTEESLFIMKSIFSVQFFNSGILVTLASFNFQDSNIPLLGRFFNGQYSEFNAAWTVDVGHIIYSTMLTNSIFPIIDWFMYWSIRVLKRMWD